MTAFTLEATDSAARAGVLHTAHGDVGVGTFAFAFLVGYALAATLRILLAVTADVDVARYAER